MRKYFLILFVVLFTIPSFGQSRAQLKKEINTLELRIDTLQSDNDYLLEQVYLINENLDAVPDKVVNEVKKKLSGEEGDLKIPTNSKEAQALYILLFGFIMWLVVKVLGGEKVLSFLGKRPKWKLSIIVGGVVAALGYFFGGMAISEVFTFFSGVVGVSGIVYNGSKSENVDTGDPTLQPLKA